MKCLLVMRKRKASNRSGFCLFVFLSKQQKEFAMKVPARKWIFMKFERILMYSNTYVPAETVNGFS